MSGRLVICADDFGRSANIDQAILTLARKTRVTAVSVMVTEPNIHASADALAELVPEIDIGLHLTLTDGTAVGRYSSFASDGRLPTIDRLTASAFLGQVPADAIAIEVNRQFDCFFALFGFEPHFVDAHQHAHLLPGIRRIVLDAVANECPRAWVRSCEDSLGAILVRRCASVRALRSSGLSAGLRAAAQRRGLFANDGFAGLYNLSGERAYARLFPRFLRCPGAANHLVICHPSVAPDEKDPIAPARVREFGYLSQTPVARLAADAGLELGRFQR
jgi:chitin disaccharide deacetylase